MPLYAPPTPTRGFTSTYHYATEGYIDGTYAASTVGRMTAAWFKVEQATTFDRIGVNVTSQGTAGAVVRLGIYAPSTGSPGSLILDAGTVDSTTTGAKTITISQALQPGWYFLAGVAQVAGCSVRSRGTPGAQWWIPESAPGAENNLSWYRDSVTGALPDPFGSSGLNGGINIKVQLRAA